MFQSTITRWHFIFGFIGMGLITAGFGFMIYGFVSDSPERSPLPETYPRAEEIVLYWFGDQKDASTVTEERLRFWSNSSPEKTKTLDMNFRTDIEQAVGDSIDHWALHPRGRLALIILLDQMAPELKTTIKPSSDYQEKALTLATQGIRMNQDADLTLIERAFFYHPLMLAESLERQSRALALYERLTQLSNPQAKPFYQAWYEKARENREVIHRFGRFPQDNERLGRESTVDEVEYLRKLSEKTAKETGE